MKRGLLTIFSLLVLGTVAATSWVFTTESGLRWSYRQLEIMLDGELRSQQLSGTFNDGVTLFGLEYDDGETRLSADRIMLQVNPWALLWLRIDVSRVEAGQLEVELREVDDSSEEQTQDAGLPQLDIPLALQLHIVAIDRLQLHQGDISLTMEDLKLQASGHGSQVDIKDLSLRLVEVPIEAEQVSDFDIKLDGAVDVSANYPHRLQIDWRTRLPSEQVIEVSTGIDGDLESTQLIQQTRGPLQSQLTLALQDLMGTLNWQAELYVTDFDTRLLDAASPLQRANLSLSAKGDLHEAQASGQLDADSSELGPLEASFTLHSLEPSRLQDGLHIDSLKLAIFDGELAAQGQLYWSPKLSWDSNLSANKINPARLLPEWPGSLNGEVHSKGEIVQGKPHVTASITDLNGELRGYPLSLQGQAQWNDEILGIESMHLQSGNTRIEAHGSVGSDLNLDWSLESRNLGELYPSAKGQLSANGHLGGQTEAPVIEAVFNGGSLQLDDYMVASIDGDIVLDLLNWQKLDVRFNARDVDFGEQHLHSIDVDADQRRIHANLVADSGSADIELAGELQNQGWSGKLLKADIESRDFEAWRLRQPAALSLAGDTVSTEQICLSSNRRAEICSALQQHGETWNIDLELVRVPLQMLHRWIPQQLELGGVINASAELQYEPGKPLLGNLKTDLPAAIAGYSDQPGNQHVIDYRQGEFELLLEPERLKLDTRFVLQNGDWIKGSALLPQADILQLDLERQTIQARVDIEARNWVVINALLPQVEILHGEMNLGIDANGLVSRPDLLFNGQLSEGAIHLLEPDIKLDQIEINLQSDGTDRFEYSASARSASGRIIINGDTILNQGERWPNSLSFELEGIDVGRLLSPMITPAISVGGSLQATGDLQLDIDSQGNIGEPTLQLNSRLSGGSIHLHETGLKIEEIELALQSTGPRQLEFHAEALAAAGRIDLRGNTLVDGDKGWPSTLEFTGENMDLAQLLAPWIIPPLVVDGNLQAGGKFSYRAPDQLFGQMRLSSAEGRLQYPLLEQAVEEWKYQDALVTLELSESGINALAGIDIGNNSDLSAKMELPRARLLALNFEQQPLQASARVGFEELNLIQLLIPEVDKLEGELALSLEVDGSLAHPRLNAKASMPLASFEVPRLGLKIGQVSLLGESDATNHFNFRMSAASADGQLSIHGVSHLGSTNQWSAELQVKGTDFEVSRIPEAQVTVSPDLKINIDTRNIHVEGDLLVPLAILQPKDISGATRVSSDSVVIGVEESEEQRWQISSRVNLALGEQVSLLGFGFEGSFDGNLLIEDKPGELSRGSGEITIREGRYRAYGQRLEVERGRLLFSGGALDNPGLDIRAQREVSDVTVGVQVHGRLKQPEFELFSIPGMSETDTLSYLLFGHPMETSTSGEGATMASAALALGLASGDYLASGLGENFGIDDVRFESNDTGDQASLVVGRYLSPKMYVSYGVGLVESINTIKLRYQLVERWYVEAESGSAQGVDLLFTIER